MSHYIFSPGLPPPPRHSLVVLLEPVVVAEEEEGGEGEGLLLPPRAHKQALVEEQAAVWKSMVAQVVEVATMSNVSPPAFLVE